MYRIKPGMVVMARMDSVSVSYAEPTPASLYKCVKVKILTF